MGGGKGQRKVLKNRCLAGLRSSKHCRLGLRRVGDPPTRVYGRGRSRVSRGWQRSPPPAPCREQRAKRCLRGRGSPGRAGRGTGAGPAGERAGNAAAAAAEAAEAAEAAAPLAQMTGGQRPAGERVVSFFPLSLPLSLSLSLLISRPDLGRGGL